METTNRILIHAPHERIFELASNVEDWGRILSHYRYVKVLKRDGDHKWVRMSAWRDIVPVTWTAIETVEKGEEGRPGRITFRHIGGLVRGMDVEWSFHTNEKTGETLVTISHRLDDPPFPVKMLGRRLVGIIVGDGFIGNIAGKTLSAIKALAEAQAREE